MGVTAGPVEVDAIQADGKIVVAGSRTTPAAVVVERFNPNGSVETTFGQAGTAVASSGTATVAKRVLIQPDG